MPRERAEPVAQQPDAHARRPWRTVAAHATAQKGYVSRAQLRDAGLTRAAIRWAVADGRLFRRRAGLFLVGHEHRPAGADHVAALLAAGPGAVLSHRAAAVVWGLLDGAQPLDVTVPVRSRSTAPIELHRARLDPRTEVTHRRGLAVTTLVRTIVDLAAVLTEPELARAVNEAAIAGRLHAANVRRIVALARGRRGAVALRRVLAERDVSRGWTRSRLERAFADLARDAALPAHERGVLVDIGGGDLRECDVVFRDQRVMVELDSLRIHETGFTPYRDRRRDRRLLAAGWVVIRITAEDLQHHRDEVIADLRAALRRGESARAAA